MSEEWGPWIDHDGKGCPCVGEWVNGVERSGFEDIWIAGTCVVEGDRVVGRTTDRGTDDCRWSWDVPGNTVWPEYHIIRYRIRKPRGLTILESLLENLPEEVDA